MVYAAGMGWRSEKAYEDAEREEWRRFLAAQPPLRRLYIRSRRVVMFGLLLAGLVVLPILLLAIN
ncbi:hypothetical protein ASD44_09680 [Mesorhizobium sp. Root554]|uniref:hypothetical protein n=1 Tax=unclassified Mesorhizobium TaxID=325217 RepID=UPI0006FC77C9|nr:MULTISPECIES: hypothetical protein [unclassified Mesorhizobium]KQZ14312.1 hypothetical protein ASD27_09690 [Mesorhizobium sp. Root1471]KQZ36823.1 hypothetical protein ASD44_09680 [Mesorhizobium sp. Root554]